MTTTLKDLLLSKFKGARFVCGVCSEQLRDANMQVDPTMVFMRYTAHHCGKELRYQSTMDDARAYTLLGSTIVLNPPKEPVLQSTYAVEG